MPLRVNFVHEGNMDEVGRKSLAWEKLKQLPDDDTCFSLEEYAQKYSQLFVSELIMAYGPCGFEQDEEENPDLLSLLHIACKSGDEELVLLLLLEGAQVNAQTRTGATPLDFCQSGDIARVMLEFGALTGDVIEVPNPQFEVLILFAGDLPSADEVALYLPRGERQELEAKNGASYAFGSPRLDLQGFEQAYAQEALEAAVQASAVMADEVRIASLATRTYMRLSLQDDGAVPYQLCEEMVRLAARLAELPGAVALISNGCAIDAGLYLDSVAQSSNCDLPAICMVHVDIGMISENLVLAQTRGMVALGRLEIEVYPFSPDVQDWLSVYSYLYGLVGSILQGEHADLGEGSEVEFLDGEMMDVHLVNDPETNTERLCLVPASVVLPEDEEDGSFFA